MIYFVYNPYISQAFYSQHCLKCKIRKGSGIFNTQKRQHMNCPQIGLKRVKESEIGPVRSGYLQELTQVFPKSNCTKEKP
jgi:hypothetical protein